MMSYNGSAYEKTIDVVAVLADIVRKWAWLLASVLAFALLLGGLQVIKPEQRTVNETQVAEVQAALDANRKLFAANEAELALNEANIAANNEKIRAKEDYVTTCLASRKIMEQNLAALQAALEEAQAVLSDAGITSAQAIAVIVKLPALSDEIRAENDRLTSLAETMQAAETEAADWQAETDVMAARSETLAAADEELSAQIAEQEKRLETLLAGSVQKKNVAFNAVLGGILGAAVFIAGMFLYYALSQKLRSSDELRENFHLPVLGEFYSEKARKHKGLGRKLDILAGDRQTLPEEESVYELAAAGIAAGVQPPARVAVIGTAPGKLLDEVAEKLRPLLPEEIDITTQENPLYQADFLAKVKEYSVLLVEAKGISNTTEIAKLVEFLCRNRVPVIGAVVR